MHPTQSINPTQIAKTDFSTEPKKEVVEESHVCNWLSCGRHFDTIEILVEHIHKDHLEKDGKRELICLWDGCNRAKKPFKVQFFKLILKYISNIISEI